MWYLAVLECNISMYCHIMQYSDIADAVAPWQGQGSSFKRHSGLSTRSSRVPGWFQPGFCGCNRMCTRFCRRDASTSSLFYSVAKFLSFPKCLGLIAVESINTVPALSRETQTLKTKGKPNEIKESQKKTKWNTGTLTRTRAPKQSRSCTGSQIGKKFFLTNCLCML